MIKFLIILTLSAILTHYTESDVQIYVVKAKEYLLGEQSYSKAKAGCQNNSNGSDELIWLHPATLSLSVYGTVQNIFDKHGINFSNEVLPNYRSEKIDMLELKCVGRILLQQASKFRVNGSDSLAFDYNTYEHAYNMPPPWRSGLAQSFVGQVFLALYLETNNNEYLNSAISTANVLFEPVNNGGVLVELNKINGESSYWFEEYAKPGYKPPMVLNGHMLTLDFLYYLNKIKPNDIYNSYFTGGVLGLSSNISKYQSLFTSYYDLNLNYANVKYHNFHIRQLLRYKNFDPSGNLEGAYKIMALKKLIPLSVFERVIYAPVKLLFIVIIFWFVLILSLVYVINIIVGVFFDSKFNQYFSISIKRK